VRCIHELPVNPIPEGDRFAILPPDRTPKQGDRFKILYGFPGPGEVTAGPSGKNATRSTTNHWHWRDELPRVRRRARHCMTGSCNSPLQPGPCATHGPEGAPGGLCNCLRRVSGAKHDSPAGFRTSDRISSSLIAPVVIPSICRVRIGLTSGRTGCSSCRSTECRRLSLQALNHEKLRTCHPITRGQALNLSPCLREAYPEPVTLSEGGGGGVQV
jgi:hypothetical protein